MLGSGELVQALMAGGLVDEYALIVSPILLGSGKRLFRDAEPVRRLTLVRSTTRRGPSTDQLNRLESPDERP